MANVNAEKNYDEKFLTSPSVIYACYSNVIGIPTELASEISELLAGETPTCYVKTTTGVPADVYEFEGKDTALIVGDIVFGNIFATEEICRKYHDWYEECKAEAIDGTELELARILLLEGFIQLCLIDGYVSESDVNETEAESETGAA